MHGKTRDALKKVRSFDRRVVREMPTSDVVYVARSESFAWCDRRLSHHALLADAGESGNVDAETS